MPAPAPAGASAALTAGCVLLTAALVLLATSGDLVEVAS